MATVVETYFIEETTNLIHDGDALEKWRERVVELQLAGQAEVVQAEKSPIPFLWMNSGLIKTFEVLCPTKVNIEKYNKTPIPVDLLDVVALCGKEKYFDGIKVWYNEKDKDPVIIGYKMKEGKEFNDRWESEYYSERYLIGRWADVKASLDSLIARAKQLFFKSETVRLKQEIRDRQRHIEDLETKIEEEFGATMPATDGLPF
jgi:hypothetical protein